MRAGYRRQLHSLTQRDDPAVASHRPHAARHLRELLRVGVFARSFSHRSGDVSSAPWEIAGTFPSALPPLCTYVHLGWNDSHRAIGRNSLLDVVARPDVHKHTAGSPCSTVDSPLSTATSTAESGQRTPLRAPNLSLDPHTKE